jgi:hypothetical protein
MCKSYSFRRILKTFWADAFISIINTQTHKNIKTTIHTLAGFEPGSYVPEADAMSTAPSSQERFSMS